MNMNTTYIVRNKCKYDIGVQLMNGVGINIKPNSITAMTVADILFIESICKTDKLFSQKMLVAVDENGKEVDVSTLGIYVNEDAPKHLDDNEILSNLKAPLKKFQAWITPIDDNAELYAIYEVAKNIDTLPISKLKILKEKMPDREWFE